MAEPRPLAHLRAAERDYGRDLWRRHEKLLRDVRADGTAWPSWCYAPMGAAYAIASGGGDHRVPPERAADIARLAALSAWRTTKGIYRYDPELLDALWTTPLDGTLPVDILLRLPEWCVYIELGGRRIRDVELHGAYVHLEHDHERGEIELRLLLDTDAAVTIAGPNIGRGGIGGQVVSGLVPAPIHLGAASGTLADGARASALRTRAEAVAAGVPDMIMRSIEQRISDSLMELAPIISVALYLCTEEPDLQADDDPQRRPRIPVGRATGAQRVTVWETGVRLGAALRRAREQHERGGLTGDRRGPVGHVRRAHWHTYWLGSEQRGDRRRELRWLAPMLVGLDGDDELLAVIRRVT